MGTPLITPASAADSDALAALAARTFTATFGHLYNAQNLERHLAEHYSARYFHRAMASGEAILLLKDGDTLMGYGKIGHVQVPANPAPPPGAVEIHRVYLDAQYQGQGYGKQLLFALLNLPQVQLAPVVYLSVYEENLTAQGLYAHYGFKTVGQYLYQVGTQSDRELIMARVKK